MKRKTVREWVKEAPPSLREAIIANYLRSMEADDYNIWMSIRVDSLAFCISGGFIWATSYEGRDHWLNIHRSLPNEFN